MAKIQVSKIESARRQLTTAINLYFKNGDPVSIHTLAAAAFQITKDLCESRDDAPDSLPTRMKDFIKPEFRGEVWGWFTETANFFKHASRDPEKTHLYNPEETEMILFIAIHQFQALTKDYFLELRLYVMWYMFHHQEFFNVPTLIENTMRLGQRLFEDDRVIFYQTMLPIVLKSMY